MNRNKVDSVKLSEIFGESKITNFSLLDNGRTSFYCENQNEKFWIRTVINGFEDKPYKDGYWPGGLYFNEELIEVHSKKEKQVIDILSKIKTPKEWHSKYSKLSKKSDGERIQELVQYVIDFLKSEKYIDFAKKTERLP